MRTLGLSAAQDEGIQRERVRIPRPRLSLPNGMQISFKQPEKSYGP
jgi:hypothetical protein